jgi:hypothetical protein
MAMVGKLSLEEEMPMAIRYEGKSYGEGGSNTAITRLWEDWWQGPDPGHEVDLRITMRIPTHRTVDDLVSLLDAIFRSGMDGGFGAQMTFMGTTRPQAVEEAATSQN